MYHTPCTFFAGLIMIWLSKSKYSKTLLFTCLSYTNIGIYRYLFALAAHHLLFLDDFTVRGT